MLSWNAVVMESFVAGPPVEGAALAMGPVAARASGDTPAAGVPGAALLPRLPNWVRRLPKMATTCYHP